MPLGFLSNTDPITIQTNGSVPFLSSFNSAAANTVTVTHTSANLLTFSSSISATGFTGSGANLTSLPAGNLTGTLPSGVLGSSTVYIGTTAVALNRGSAAIALTGITSIDGNAATATTLQNARTIATSGDVTGTATSFNGSANITIPTTIGDTTVTGKLLTGYIVGTNTALAATDSILTAFNKIQGQLNAKSGTVTSVSVATANGFGGTVATATTTPAITISTSITGLLKGNGTAISAATAGTDYLTPSGSAASLTNFPFSVQTAIAPINTTWYGIQSPPWVHAAINSMNQDILRFRVPDLVEYKAAGGAWASGTGDNNIFLGSNLAPGGISITSAQDGVRWTYNDIGYILPSYLYIAGSTNGNNCQILVETSPDGTTWTTVVTSTSFTTWPGYSIVSLNGVTTSGNAHFRITHTRDHTNTNSVNIQQLKVITAYGMFQEANLFTWDFNKNVTFPSTTASTSYTTGAVLISGGLGVAGNGNFNGSIVANGTVYTGGRVISSGTVSPNLHLDPTAGGYSIYLNYYQGTGGTKFCNGANGIVASIDGSGNFSGTSIDLPNTGNWTYIKNSAVGGGLKLQTSGTDGISITSSGGYIKLHHRTETGSDNLGEPITMGALTPKTLIYGASQSTTLDSILRLVRPTTSGSSYPGSVDFKINRYTTGSVAPFTQLVIGLKASSSYDISDTVDVLTLKSDGTAVVAQAFTGGGITLGLTSGVPRITYGASSSTGFGFLTAGNAYADLYAASFVGSGANLTGTAASLTAGYANGANIGLVRNLVSANTGDIAGVTTANFRTTLFGSTTSGFQLATARWNNVPTLISGMAMYGTMIAWAGSDTHAFLAVNYNGGGAKIGGGNADLINWTADLITSANFTSQALTTSQVFTAISNQNNSDWYRTTGAVGIYFASYSTGLYATAAQFIETYNGGSLKVNGTLYATGDVIAYYTSDKRLKENIHTIENAVSKVKRLNGVSYNWNQTYLNSIPEPLRAITNRRDIGLIAQEVEAVLPELVTTKDTGYKGIKYDRIVALLVEAIKEQQLEIDELKRKI